LASLTKLPHLGITLSDSITFAGRVVQNQNRGRRFYYIDLIGNRWAFILILLVNLWLLFVPLDPRDTNFLFAALDYAHQRQNTYLVAVIAGSMLLGVFLVFSIAVRLIFIRMSKECVRILQLAGPKPPFVLYLRSFAGRIKKKQSCGMRFLSRLLPLVSWERLVLSPLSYVGPLIAIGRPNEKLPKFPGYVHYVQDAGWQHTVKQLISSSAAIVVCAADTDAVAWELRQVLEKDRDRLLILWPPAPLDERRGAWLRVLPSFSEERVLRVLAELDIDDLIGITFRRGNIVHFQGGGRRLEQWQDCVTAFYAGIVTSQFSAKRAAKSIHKGPLLALMVRLWHEERQDQSPTEQSKAAGTSPPVSAPASQNGPPHGPPAHAMLPRSSVLVGFNVVVSIKEGG
jgi:hypothetical protein